MCNRTPLHAIAKWAVSRITALDDRIFAADELAAVRRGWQVGRPRRFTRTYHDPRWDQVATDLTRDREWSA